MRLSAQTILLDNFNADGTGPAPSGWTAVTTGGTASVQEMPAAKDKSARLSKTGTTGTASVARSFPTSTGKIGLEFKLRSEETTGTKRLVISNSSGAANATISFSGASLCATDGASLKTLQPYTASTWYLIRLETDTVAGTYDVYVDGVRKLTGLALASQGSNVAKITYSMTDGSKGTGYLDGVNIYMMAIAPDPEQGTFLSNDNMNGDPTGGAPRYWTVTTGGGVTVQEVPFPLDKSLCIQKTSSANSAFATKSFPVTTGKVTIELKVRTESTTDYKNVAYVYGNNGAKAVSVAFDDANLTTYVGGVRQTVLTGVDAGTWYQIRIVLDTSAQKYDLYVDGQRLITGGAFRENATNVTMLQCGIDANQLGTLYIDNVRITAASSFIGAPPLPLFDVATARYGAVGNGTTDNTTAIQKAIDECAGSGGSVYLHDGIFLTGTIQLKSGMTLFIDSSAVLLGSNNLTDYPTQDVPLVNGTVNNAAASKLALIFLRGASNVVIDGGGRIDGNGQTWADGNGHEAIHPILILPVACNTLTIRNVYLERAAMWCVVPQESKYVTVRNVNLYSDIFGNRDGIDPVDCSHVLLDHCTIRTEDDSVCPKSGTRAGSDDLTVQSCFLGGSTKANGIKFGTYSYGTITNYLFQDVFLKNISDAAISLESVDGSDISGVTFRRIEMRQTNSPFYLIIGLRGNHPTNDVKKIGSIDNILFEDITGSDFSRRTGCPISGVTTNGVTYPLTNLTFRRVHINFLGGCTIKPSPPPEMDTRYPNEDVWGDMPAYGYFLRHINNIVFEDCTTTVSSADVRPARYPIDVTGLQDK